MSHTYAHGNRRGDEGCLSNTMYHVVSVLPVSMIDVSRGGVSVFYTPRAIQIGLQNNELRVVKTVNSPNRPLCEAHDHPQAPWTPIKP